MLKSILKSKPVPRFIDYGDRCMLAGDTREFRKRAFGDTYKQVLERVSGIPVGKVLDIGAGEGFLSLCLHKMGHSVIACDVNKEQFKTNEVAFIEFDMINYAESHTVFPDESFDYIIVVEVLEHMENPRGLMREISRILRPGGFTVISTPNIHTLQSRIMFLFLGEWMSFRDNPSRLKDESGFDGHITPIPYWLLKSFASDVGLKYKTEHFSYGGLPAIPWLKLPRNRLFGRSMIVTLEKVDIDL